MTFKEKLIRLRKIKSLTQDDFAKAVGVSRQAVYKWESGQSYPEVPKLREIKLLFGISIDDLLDDTYDVELPEKKRKKRMSKAEKERIEALIRAEEGLDDDADDSDNDINMDEPLDDKADAVADDSDTVEADEPKADISADELFGNSAADTAADEPAGAPAVDDTVADTADDSVAEKKGFFGRIFGKK